MGGAEFIDGHRGRKVRAALLLACLWGLMSLSCAGRPSSSSRQKLEVQKHLNRLNKSPTKTIQVYFLSLDFLSFSYTAFSTHCKFSKFVCVFDLVLSLDL